MLTGPLAWAWALFVPLLLVVGARCLPPRGDGPERGTALVGAVIGGVALIGLALLAGGLGPALPPLPSSWLVILQDGPGRTNLHAIAGRIDHAGPGFEALLGWFDGDQRRDLPQVIRVNLLLGLFNAALFFGIAGTVLRSALGATLAAAILLAFPWPLLTLRSDLATAAVTTAFLAGVLAVAAFDRAGSRDGRRVQALALLVLAAGLAAACRAETVLVGGPAVLWLVARMVRGDAALARSERRALTVLSRPSRWPARARWQVLLALGLGLVLWRALPGGWPRWAGAGLYPLNPSFMTLPVVLLGLLPAGVAALATLGLVVSLGRIGQRALLPVTLLVLLRTWLAASTGDPEPMLRYGTMLAPAALLFALYGWSWMEERAAQRRWGRGWRVLALLALAGLSIPVPGQSSAAARARTSNPTREARFLLARADAMPSCVFVARVPAARRWQEHDGSYVWLAFGGGLRELREAPAGDMTARNFALRLLPDATCVVVYRGLDCSLVGEEGCRSVLEAGAPLALERFASEPWADREHGAHEAEIVLGVYRVDPPDW